MLSLVQTYHYGAKGARSLSGGVSGGLSRLALAAALGLTLGLGHADVAAARGLPWYAWIGGLYGAIFVVAAAWGVPRLGVAMTITLMVGGQLLLSLILDHFGALGVPRQPLNLGRIAGVALVIAGVVLVRRS